MHGPPPAAQWCGPPSCSPTGWTPSCSPAVWTRARLQLPHRGLSEGSAKLTSESAQRDPGPFPEASGAVPRKPCLLLQAPRPFSPCCHPALVTLKDNQRFHPRSASVSWALRAPWKRVRLISVPYTQGTEPTEARSPWVERTNKGTRRTGRTGPWEAAGLSSCRSGRAPRSPVPAPGGVRRLGRRGPALFPTSNQREKKSL